MAGTIHPAAIHHLPPFVTAPGETDALFVAVTIFVLLAVIGIGVFYFKLHALPEHMAHRGQKIQFEIVAVLTLISLFTHNHAFWIAGLLLALVPIPDFTTPLQSIAGSLERIASAAGPARAAPPPVRQRPAEPAPSRQSPPPQAPAPAPAEDRPAGKKEA